MQELKNLSHSFHRYNYHLFGKMAAADGILDDVDLDGEAETLARRYYFHDHLGSVRAVVDGEGEFLSAQDFFPYGDHLQSPAFNEDSYKYTGHERDYDLGLDYMMARHYSYKTGRFVSVDPVLNFKHTLSYPGLWNRYSYGLNNPLKYIDPKGKEAELSGNEEEKKALLYYLQMSVAPELRMFIRTTTTSDGRTIIDPRYLNMMASARSGNFQALRVVANSPGLLKINLSEKYVQTKSFSGEIGVYSWISGITSPPKESISGHTEIWVGGNLSRLESTKTLAHEMVHAMLILLGRPWKDEMKIKYTTFSNGSGSELTISLDSTGPVNILTSEVEEEAARNYEFRDPFVPLIP